MTASDVARVCGIHQPNLFPRLVTLAKLLAADCWVVLDDVQFCRQDYQHRARLGRVDEPAVRQWLILPVHLPAGQASVIRDVRLSHRTVAQKRVANLLRQYYRRAPGWARVADVVDAVTAEIGATDSLAAVAETSTRLMLRACGWDGEIIRSSALARRGPISTERSGRLADLTRAAGCDTYLCGRSGKSYLHSRPFARSGTRVSFFELPDSAQGPLVDLTALATLAADANGGPGVLTRAELRTA